jgi:DNA-binding winged helix-turn-helix (wHTH) protein/TolB-like protein
MNEENRSSVYEFGQFRLDARARQLHRSGVPVQLTAKAVDTLLVLLENHGDVIAKSDLMDRVWGETAVEENNLTQQISALRKAFGEKASDHKFIVTVPGRGYSFVAAVRNVDEGVAAPAVNPGRVVFDVFRSRSFFGYGLAFVYVLVVCVPSLFINTQMMNASGKTQTIAVLRFRSAGVGDELLGMGIRDTLRAKLGTLDDVAVRPEITNINSADVVDAGHQLHADVVLTGSIQRDEGRVRVAVEMVDINNERIVWGNTFDESVTNAFDLQDSIANAVMTALKAPKLRSSIDVDLPYAS